ncbi:hypothetical protein NM208_g16877 [Fusarium decemcellulare]|uniref:Uncharacterized protein n=1 Tax=Fusarium decemcellulare TaxID=57161 RepID=A0ACC1RAU2_9HYPO|nr:hypothetical protein NM208_g16877 [Fusarium decemcellulare]
MRIKSFLQRMRTPLLCLRTWLKARKKIIRVFQIPSIDIDQPLPGHLMREINTGSFNLLLSLRIEPGQTSLSSRLSHTTTKRRVLLQRYPVLDLRRFEAGMLINRASESGGSSSSTPSRNIQPKSSFKSVRFATPLIGLPPLAPKPIKPRSTSTKIINIGPTAKSEFVDLSAENPTEPVTEQLAASSGLNEHNTLSTIHQEHEDPNKRRLRPRKRKTLEIEPAKADTPPAAKKPRVIKPAKAKNAKAGRASASVAPPVKKIKIIRSAKPKTAKPEDVAQPCINHEPRKNERVSTNTDTTKHVLVNQGQPMIVAIESTDEDES